MNKNLVGIAAVAVALLLVVLLFTDRDAFAWVLAGIVLIAVILGDVIRVQVLERRHNSA